MLKERNVYTAHKFQCQQKNRRSARGKVMEVCFSPARIELAYRLLTKASILYFRLPKLPASEVAKGNGMNPSATQKEESRRSGSPLVSQASERRFTSHLCLRLLACRTRRSAGERLRCRRR